jgi:fluoroquinolone transport system permease protein
VNTHVIGAMRVLAPNDLRLIWRDGFLLSFLMVVLPLACLGLHWLVPYVGGLVAEWVELEPYYGLILANVLVAGEPVLLGFVIGVLFIEERDEGTLLALQASPLSLRSFLGYRLLAAMVLNVLLTMVGVLLADLVSVSWLELLASAALASLAVPLVALVYAVYIKNKVQALMILKPVQIWGGVPTLLFFVPTPWQWIGSVPGPLYYPMRLFWSATDGQAEWWLMVPGLIIPGVALLWLLRSFERTVYA